MDIIVRRASVEDAVGLVELNKSFNEVVVSANDVINSLNNNSSEVVFVAVRNNELLGFLCIDIHHSFCYEVPNAEITELFVRKTARGKNIATQLVNVAVDYAREKKVDEIHIRTGTKNSIANEFYLSLGFRLGSTNTYYVV